MKIIKPIFIFILIIFIVLVFLEIIPIAPKYNNTNSWIIKEEERPLVIPTGSSNLLYPNNTKYSFIKIVEDGYDVLDINLCLTADDILISMPNVINQILEEDTQIRDYTYDQLIKYNYAFDFVNLDGEKPFASVSNDDALNQNLVPAKLEYLFKDYSNKKYIIHVVKKSNEDSFNIMISLLIKLIKAYHMESQVIIFSYDEDLTDLIQKESNTIMTSTNQTESYNFVLYSTLNVDFFYKPKDSLILLPINENMTDSLYEKFPKILRNKITTFDKDTDSYYINLARQSIIDDAHRHNMAAIYYTANNEDEMEKLIKMGVDGIITDRPDILVHVLEELGY